MMFGKSLLWLACSFLACPFFWGFFASLSGSIWDLSKEDVLGGFVLGILFGPIWGFVVVAALAPFYALPLLLWPPLVRRFSRLDENRKLLIVTTGFLALPGAWIVGSSFASFAETFRIREFAISFPPALAAGWLALLSPRLLVRRLAPGTFSETSPPHAA